MNTRLANPFTDIVSHPRVVPQAVERVIQATVSADYLNRRLVEAARSNLLKAQAEFHSLRMLGRDLTFVQRLLYDAMDRVTAAQDMAGSFFAPPPVPPASVLTEILS